jgi:flagellar L-ring protein FlgH
MTRTIPRTAPRLPSVSCRLSLLPIVAIAAAAVTVATPVRAHAQAAAAPSTSQAAAPAPQPRPRRSWTSDRRDFVVGDVITVALDEFTLASANTGNSATDRKRRDASFDLSTGSGTPTRFDFGTRNDGESQQRGEATRQNRFQGDISVRIVAIDPATGLLQVKGQKLVNVDKNQQTVAFAGYVRPQDVSPANVVESMRVADAQLTYLNKGGLGKPKGGIVSKVVGMLWP